MPQLSFLNAAVQIHFFLMKVSWYHHSDPMSGHSRQFVYLGHLGLVTSEADTWMDDLTSIGLEKAVPSGLNLATVL